MGPMPLKDPTFTIGIEEEYLLVDRASRDLVREMPQALFEDCERALGGQVAREFLKSQIEVGTAVHASPRAAGAELEEGRDRRLKVGRDLSNQRFQFHNKKPRFVSGALDQSGCVRIVAESR